MTITSYANSSRIKNGVMLSESIKIFPFVICLMTTLSFFNSINLNLGLVVGWMGGWRKENKECVPNLIYLGLGLSLT